MLSYEPATIVSNTVMGENVRHVIITPQSPLPFEAGQFFMIRVRDAAGELVERSYSAANFSAGEVIEFVIRIEPNGKMSQIIDTLQPGATLDMKGPFGRFGFSILPKEVERIVLIAGGVGVSPLRSMIQKSFQAHEKHPIQLFYGFRTPKDFLFQSEFEGFLRPGHFEIISSISKPADCPDWKGLTGYILNHLEGKIAGPDAGTHTLICGPPPMVKATREKLFSLGFDRQHVHVEAW